MERLKFVNCVETQELNNTWITTSSCNYVYEKYDINKDIQEIWLWIINFTVIIFFYVIPYITIILVLRKIENKFNKKKIWEKTGK